MKQAAVSMRPGTIFGYQDKLWKVTGNDTLNQVFTAITIPERDLIRAGSPRSTGNSRSQRGSGSSSSSNFVSQTKRFRYSPGQMVEVRWVPHSNELTRYRMTH